MNEEPIDIVEIRNWLKAPDPSINFVTACDKKTSGTGEWILSQPEYIHWCQGAAQLLWIQGKGKDLLLDMNLNLNSNYLVGSGRTILS